MAVYYTLEMFLDLIDLCKIEKIKEVLRANPSLANSRNKNGLTPLKLAAYGGKTKIVKCLIQNGAKLNNKYEDGGDLLLYASSAGNKDIADLLIKNGVDVNFQNEEGYSALHLATLKGFKDFVEFLISKGSEINVQNKDGMTPLIIATALGERGATEVLVNNNADFNKKTKKGHTAVHLSIYNKNQDLVELLIEKGADLEVRDDQGKTALMVVLEEDTIDIARLLINKGADLNARWPEYNVKGYLANGAALHFVAYSGNYELARLILEKGAELNLKNESGSTPLQNTIIPGNLRIAKLLIEKGADINSKNDENQTPLYVAILFRRKRIANFLINKGANIHIGSKDNFAPIHLAAISNQKNILQLLIDSGAAVCSRAKNDMTPLHMASVKGFVDIAEILLQNRADIGSKNKDGWTPIKLASDHGNYQLVHLFITKGANPGIIKNDGRSTTEKQRWTQAAWRSESGELPREVISRINDKYVRPLDELKEDIDSQHKKGINTVLVSSKGSLEERLERLSEKITIVSSMHPYTADLVEIDSVYSALIRYKNLQKEKNEMRKALIVDNLAEARLLGYSDVEIDEEYGKLILSRNVDLWDDRFDVWMKLECEKIKELIRENPSFANIEYVMRDLLICGDVEFYDVSDFMDFFKDIPSVVWEKKFLDIVASTSFEIIWSSGFFIILDNPGLFQNRTRLVEILSNWEKELEALIKSKEINKYISDERRLFMKLFGFGPERTLKDIRKCIQKLHN